LTRRERQQGHVASALDGDRQRALVLGARAGLTARLDLRPIGNHPPQPLHILVIRDNLISGELIDLPAREETPAAATAATEAPTATGAITTGATGTGTTRSIAEATATATTAETATRSIAETTATLLLIVNHLLLLVRSRERLVSNQ
jgi:hypothetical protein